MAHNAGQRKTSDEAKGYKDGIQSHNRHSQGSWSSLSPEPYLKDTHDWIKQKEEPLSLSLYLWFHLFR